MSKFPKLNDQIKENMKMNFSHKLRASSSSLSIYALLMLHLQVDFSRLLLMFRKDILHSN